MADLFERITEKHKDFIQRQHMFFVGTAASTGRVNLSPKGMDTLRVLGPNQIIWLNLTGSGNETAAHLLDNDRMTLMFCSFDKAPLILRVYGHATTITPDHPQWQTLISHFPPLPGARQIFDMAVDLVQTSCGFAVPRYEFIEQRETLRKWAEQLGEEELAAYRRQYNQVSLDGKPIVSF